MNWTRIVRWIDWGPSKLPVILTLSFLWILERHPSVDDACLKLGGLLLFAVFGFSFGFLINDYSDRWSDRRAGKRNAMEGLSVGLAFVLLLAMVAGGAAVLLSVHAGIAPLILGVLSYAVAVVYSVGPRLKERGAFGLFVAAVAQRTIPALFTLVLFEDIRVEPLILTLVYTVVGLRWMLMHQAIDFRRDRISGVRTFISTRDRKLAQDLIRRAVFPIELFALSVWLLLAIPHLPGLAAAAFVYLFWFVLRRRVLGGEAYSWMSYANPYLGEVYGFFLPVSLGIMTVAAQPSYWPLLTLAAGLTGGRFAADVSILYRALRDLRLRRRGGETLRLPGPGTRPSVGVAVAEGATPSERRRPCAKVRGSVEPR